MVTADNIHEVLAALKDAGVTYARFGEVEFHFAPAVVAASAEDVPPLMTGVLTMSGAQLTNTVSTIAPQTDSSKPEPHRPGYAQLFPRPPRFEPA